MLKVFSSFRVVSSDHQDDQKFLFPDYIGETIDLSPNEEEDFFLIFPSVWIAIKTKITDTKILQNKNTRIFYFNNVLKNSMEKTCCSKKYYQKI